MEATTNMEVRYRKNDEIHMRFEKLSSVELLAIIPKADSRFKTNYSLAS